MVAEELFLRVVKVKYIPCISRSQAIKLRCCPSDCQSDKFIEYVYGLLYTCTNVLCGEDIGFWGLSANHFKKEETKPRLSTMYTIKWSPFYSNYECNVWNATKPWNILIWKQEHDYSNKCTWKCW